MAIIARNHAPMVDVLVDAARADGTPLAPRLLAKLDRGKWRELMEDNGIDPPAFADARNDEERIDMFAASLKEQAERLFPDVAMIGAVERDAQQINHLPAVVKFIDDHPEFDLSESNVAKFNIEAGDALTVEVLTGVSLWSAAIHQAVGTLVFVALAFAFLRPFARRHRFGPG